MRKALVVLHLRVHGGGGIARGAGDSMDARAGRELSHSGVVIDIKSLWRPSLNIEVAMRRCEERDYNCDPRLFYF